MKCEIINVGTELLLGDIVNTNHQYLARELAALGIGVYLQSSVGDNHDRLKTLLKGSLERCDLIILTGGLGPTVDDITKSVAAETLGIPIIRNADCEEKLRQYFKKSNWGMTENNLLQADMPENAIIFENHNGTAPGCAMEKDGKIVILLPGPPKELIPMFQQSVLPYLAGKGEGTIYSTNIRIFGIGESAVDNMLSDFFKLQNPTVAPYAKDAEVLVRVTAMAENEELAKEKCKPIVENLTAILKDYVYAIDMDSLEEALVQKLKSQNKTVAIAESCTGGMLAQRITNVSGASDVFELGIVSYSEDKKIQTLGVSAQTIEKHSVYSPEVACEMAQCIRNIAGSDFGIGVTGIAGPTGGTDKVDVGTVFIAAASSKGIKSIEISRRNSSREKVRIYASNHALNLCLKQLEEQDDSRAI